MKKENESGKTITYKIKLIVCVKFMSSSLSTLADNHAEGLHKDKYKNYKSDLEYMTAKENTVTFKCEECKKIYEKEFDKDLAKRFKTHTNSVMETLASFA